LTTSVGSSVVSSASWPANASAFTAAIVKRLVPGSSRNGCVTVERARTSCSWTSEPGSRVIRRRTDDSPAGSTSTRRTNSGSFTTAGSRLAARATGAGRWYRNSRYNENVWGAASLVRSVTRTG